MRLVVVVVGGRGWEFAGEAVHPFEECVVAVTAGDGGDQLFAGEIQLWLGAVAELRG
jgi:hypothetical protein